MPFVPVENTVMAELRYTWDNEPVENTLYFRSADAPSAASMLALGNAIITWWGVSLQSSIADVVEFREVYLTDLTTATGPAVTANTGLPLLGSANNEPVPSNVAPCISFRTDMRGRSFRGRNYLIGLPGDSVDSNTINATYLSDMVAAYQDLMALVASVDFVWVVVSRYSGSTIVDGKKVPTPRTAGIATEVTTVVFTDNIVDSQRGRLPNH